jgi:hypothetical protein
LKKYKLPGGDQIPAELFKTGGEILLSAIHKLINSVWNKIRKNCSMSGRSLLFYQLTRGVINLALIIIEYPSLKVKSV